MDQLKHKWNQDSCCLIKKCTQSIHYIYISAYVPGSQKWTIQHSPDFDDLHVTLLGDRLTEAVEVGT